jgi:hypothetical protein
MPLKPLRRLNKKRKFEQWELDFMRNGPPPYEEQLESPYRFFYLDGFSIWQRLKKEPDFNRDDFPWAVWAFRNKEKSNENLGGESR